MTAKQPKFTKARRSYKCGACAGTIEPGDFYRCRTVTRASNRGQSVELRDGYPTVIEHGFRVRTRVCQGCCSGSPIILDRAR